MTNKLRVLALLILVVSSPPIQAGLTYDGTGDYIGIPVYTSIRITGNMTLCAWARFSLTQANRPILARWGGDEAYLLYVDFASSDKITFITRVSEANKSATTASSYNTDTWTHFCGVFDGTNVKVLVNQGRTEDVTGSATAGPTDNPADVPRIACYSNATTVCFTGSIAHVAIFNRVLTTGDMTTVAYKGAHRVSGLQGYWTGNWTAADPNLSPATDKEHGTVNGPATAAATGPPIGAMN
jgi:hypothetical protein